MTCTAPMPLPVRVHFAHAVAQALAEQCGADVLHVKGPAIDPSLGLGSRQSTDADVLVRPEHIEAFLDVLREHGWRCLSDFETGSPFGHAANYFHPAWGCLDVHRHWPGLGVPPERAFSRLWQNRQLVSIAHRPCPTPDTVAQATIVLLHAARGQGTRIDDVEAVWHCADEPRRSAIRALAAELKAEVALAAAIGELDRHAATAERQWWAYWSGPRDSRVREWAARLRAARGLGAKAAVLRRALSIDHHQLARVLEREPRGVDVFRAQIGRGSRALRDAARLMTSRVPLAGRRLWRRSDPTGDYGA